MALIQVDQANKKRLDQLAILLANQKGVKSVTYNEIVTKILDVFEEVKFN